MKKILGILGLALCFSLQAVDVCFLTTQEESAFHFMKLTEALDKKNISWQIFAADQAESFLKEKKISHRKISIWMNKKGVKDLSYNEIIGIAKLTAKECKKAKIVITEISDPLISRFHYELALISSAQRWVYYDQKETYIPGEYSKCFDQLLKTRPEGVIFAHKDLCSQILFGENRRILECAQINKWDLDCPLFNQEQMLNESKETYLKNIVS